MSDADTALPPECDFCGQALDADESLSPVYLGEQPAPEPIRLEAFAPKQTGFDGRFLGHSVGELSALFDALDDDRIAFDTYDRVIRVDGEATFDRSVHESMRSVGKTIKENTCAARVVIDPDPPDPEPDLEVCPLCRENLRAEADGWSPSD